MHKIFPPLVTKEETIGNNNDEYYRYNIDNMLSFPTVTEEHLSTLEELKKEIDYSSTFDFTKFTNIIDLRKKITNFYVNAEYLKNDSAVGAKMTYDIVNSFIYETYKKYFLKDHPFYNRLSDLNKIVYIIINSYDIPFNDIPIIWYSIRKCLSSEFNLNNSQIGFLRGFFNSYVTTRENYPCFFTCEINSKLSIKYRPQSKAELERKKSIKENTVTIRNFLSYIIDNGKARLNDNCNFGKVRIQAYKCTTKLNNYLTSTLNTYTNNCLDSTVQYRMQMDHLHYKISGLKGKDGFCHQFCDSGLNNLLSNFSYDDRLFMKILKYNEITFKKCSDANTVNYTKLLNNVPSNILEEWKTEIKNIVENFANKVKGHLKRRLTDEEIEYIGDNYCVSGPLLYKRKRKTQKEKYKHKYFDHSHKNSVKIFNFLTKYLNIDYNVSNNNELQEAFIRIGENDNQKFCLLKYLFLNHIHHYGRGLIDRQFNLILGHYETLQNECEWSEEKIWEEIYNIMIGNPIVNWDNHLMVYRSQNRSTTI
ncbi:hypothetical protein ABK040_007841 [Willaertia magna]